jgi:AraC family transcriptional regulator
MSHSPPPSDAEPRAALAVHPSLTRLLNDALRQMRVDQAAARERIAEAIALAGSEGLAPTAAGGLAPWQTRRIDQFIDAHLANEVRMEMVAQEARISASYFSRAFKRTYARSFSEHLVHCRLERARSLLETSTMPISEIALACGLTDQSHLTRLFHRNYGAPPRAWRRARGALDQCSKVLEAPN